MGSIFREIDKAFTLTTDEVRLNALAKVNKYIKEGSWEKKIGGSKPVLLALGMKQTEACNKLNMSVSAYKVMMKRASDHIKNIIGEDIIRDILYGDAEEIQSALVQFNIRTKAMLPEVYFPKDLYDAVNKNNEKEYNIADLEEEINFLKENTKGYLEERLLEREGDKLSFIFNVLSSSDSKYTILRAKLFEEIVMSCRSNSKLLKK